MPKRRSQREPTNIDRHVGRRIMQRRMIIGLSQAQLAAMLGYSFQQLQKYENGSNRVSASRLYQFSQVLRAPITWFYEDVDETGNSRSRAPERAKLLDPEVLRFVRAYCSIKDAGAQLRLRELATALAGKK